MDGILGIDEILFFVPDVSQAKSWYAHLLGQDPIFDDAGYCAFDFANITVGLHPSDDKTSPGVAGQVAYWRVKDISDTIQHFISHGCTLFRGPILGVDNVWICQLKDPFGNVWGLVQK